jgi:hypothetical protein
MNRKNLIEIMQNNCNCVVSQLIDNPDKDIKKIPNSDWLLIITNKLDIRNDNIELYIKDDTDGLVISDDGYIFNNLYCLLDDDTKANKIAKKYKLKFDSDTSNFNIYCIHQDINKFINDFVKAILEIQELI